jgi:hypothetical protein
LKPIKKNIRHFLVISIWIFLALPLHGQFYSSPKKAASGITLNIEINDAKDLEFIRTNIKKFYGVQKVRVNGNVNISKVASTISLLDDIEDVQLIKFTGELTDTDLELLAWVGNVTLYLRNGREDQILLNNYLGKLNGLTLIFEIAPDDYSFMAGWTKVKSLNFIAPFVSKEVPAAIVAASKLPSLTSFGISLDKMTDLPASIKNIAGLKKLTIIDNLSWMTEKFIDNLAVLHKNVEYFQGAAYRNVDFYYKATDAELTVWERDYLLSIFPTSRFAPLMSASGDTSMVASFADFVKLNIPKEPSFELPSKEKPVLPDFKEGDYNFIGNNAQDRVYYLGNDAAILVPKGCMASLKDTLWNGNYNLRLKFLNQPRSLFAKGYSTRFDSSGVSYDLATAAIFEMNAAAGTVPLHLREGYFIKAVFLTAYDTANRFYAFNGSKSLWANVYDYDYYFDDSKIVPIDFYSFYSNKHTASELLPLDRSSDYKRFETDGYFYLMEPGVNRLSLESFNGYYVVPVTNRAPKMGAYTLRRGRGLVGLKKEYTDKKAEKDVFRFQVFDKTATLFPELKAFDNYVLEIQTSLSSREFSTQFIRGAIYSDIRFFQEGNSWFMDLRTETGYWRLKILQPSEKFKQNSTKARLLQAEFLRRMKQYNATKTAKSNAYSQWAAQFQESTILNAKRVLFYGQIKPRGMAVYEFKVRTLGLFAWAKPVIQPDTFGLTIQFTDAGGIPLDVKKAFVAHSKPFSYKAINNQSTYNFDINPNKLQYIACVDFKNRVFVMNADAFKISGVKGNSLVYLPMNEITKSVKNAGELDAILGIKLR